MGPVLHFMYVKGDYRRQGIGEALWRQALEQVGHDWGKTPAKGREVRYTHKMPGTVWGNICKRQGWVYNGYLAFRYNPWRHAA
jgi:GNAT superfamily N-acetyltransferase